MLEEIRSGFKRLDWAWNKFNTSKEDGLGWVAKGIPQCIGPNFLSSMKIGAAMAILVMLSRYASTSMGGIIFCFFIAVVSDLLDGRLARLRKKVTEIGALLDMVGDRILICSTVSYLLWKHYPTLTKIVLFVEILSISVAILAMIRKISIKSSRLAKCKMGAQGAGIIVLLVLPSRTGWAFIAFIFGLLFAIGSFSKSVMDCRQRTV